MEQDRNNSIGVEYGHY